MRMLAITAAAVPAVMNLHVLRVRVMDHAMVVVMDLGLEVNVRDVKLSPFLHLTRLV